MKELNFVQIMRKYGFRASARYLGGPYEITIETSKNVYKKVILAPIDFNEILEKARLKCDLSLVKAINELKTHTWEELFGPSWTH